MTSGLTSATKTKATADGRASQGNGGEAKGDTLDVASIRDHSSHSAEETRREYTVVVATRGPSDSKEFLLVRHRERGWELPGGRLESNEGPVHCALREFREETGHLLAAPHFVTKLHKPNGTCYIFTGTLGAKAEGSVEPSTEAIQEWRWFRRLPRDLGLGFPDDPYEEMGLLLGIEFG